MHKKTSINDRLFAATYPSLEGGNALILSWRSPERQGQPFDAMAMVLKPTGGPMADIHVLRLQSDARMSSEDLLDAAANRMDLVIVPPPSQGAPQETIAAGRSALSAFRMNSMKKADVVSGWQKATGQSTKGAIDRRTDPRYRLTDGVKRLASRISSKKMGGFATAAVLDRGQGKLDGLATTMISAGFALDKSKADGQQRLSTALSRLVDELGAGDVFERFAQSVDLPQARAALRACPDANSFSIGWYGTRDPAKGEARRQAAEAWPLLADFIARRPSIRDAVDNREPVITNVIEATGLSKGALKRLGAVDDSGIDRGPVFEDGPARGVDGLGYNRLRRLSVAGSFSIQDAVKVLAELPPDWTPKDNGEWKAFSEITAGAVLPLQRAFGLPAKDLLAGAKGRWQDYRDSLARSAEIKPEMMDRRAIALTTIDALEIGDSLARQVIVPLAIQTIHEEGFVPPRYSDTSMLLCAQQAAMSAMLFKSKSGLGGMFEIARRWITRSHNVMAMLTDPKTFMASGDVILRSDGQQNTRRSRPEWDDGEWEPVAPMFRASNGLTIQALTSHEELQQESRRLGHCVGQSEHYTRKCRAGTGHILSVRTGDGLSSLSTIEIEQVHPGERRVVERQHQGTTEEGRRVPPSAVSAWKEWQSALAGGDLVLNDWLTDYAAFASDRYETSTGSNARISWRGICGFVPTDAQMLGHLWDTWRGVLGGETGKANHPGVLYRVPEVQGVVEHLSASTFLSLKRKEEQRRLVKNPEGNASREPTQQPAVE